MAENVCSGFSITPHDSSTKGGYEGWNEGILVKIHQFRASPVNSTTLCAFKATTMTQHKLEKNTLTQVKYVMLGEANIAVEPKWTAWMVIFPMVNSNTNFCHWHQFGD